jgi:NAD(P)-dependent dehydrogenase (short-subunit alcohol dehydrogenase family)
VHIGLRCRESRLSLRERTSYRGAKGDSNYEIAAMVAYLAGPEAGFVTGASLTIDGGFTA